jgi:hypothetical protein
MQSDGAQDAGERCFKAGALHLASLRSHQVRGPFSHAGHGSILTITVTHLLTVIFREFIQEPGPLLPSQVAQEGSQDRTDMLWGGKEKREHAEIRAVIIASFKPGLLYWRRSKQASLTAAID